MWGAWGEPRLSNSDVSCACTTQLADRAVCRCSGWENCRIMSASMKSTLTYLRLPLRVSSSRFLSRCSLSVSPVTAPCLSADYQPAAPFSHF